MAETAANTNPLSSPHPVPLLPEDPIIIIEPSRSWVALNLRDLWVYRELFYFLIWRDVKIRFKQTLLGAGWAVIQPLTMMLIFTIFFGKLVRIPSDGVPYTVFSYAGLLLWTFFSSAVLNSGNSVVGSSSLITKVYFPRIIIPCAAVGARLVDFIISFILLAGLMIYYGILPTRSMIFLPVFVLLTILLAAGVGMWVSALNVKYRDVGMILPVMIQLWMFASPIIYPSSLLPEKWRWVYALNPMVGIIEGFRASLFGQKFDLWGLVPSTIITLILLVYSAYAFRRMEKSFADLV